MGNLSRRCLRASRGRLLSGVLWLSTTTRIHWDSRGKNIGELNLCEEERSHLTVVETGAPSVWLMESWRPLWDNREVNINIGKGEACYNYPYIGFSSVYFVASRLVCKDMQNSLVPASESSRYEYPSQCRELDSERSQRTWNPLYLRGSGVITKCHVLDWGHLRGWRRRLSAMMVGDQVERAVFPTTSQTPIPDGAHESGPSYCMFSIFAQSHTAPHSEGQEEK